MSNINERHGGPYDRGNADSYYRRPFTPHFYKGDTHNSDIVKLKDMCVKEIAEYTKGFNDNEASAMYKEYD